MRAEITLSERGDKRFEPFDSFSRLQISKGKNLPQFLGKFRQIRKAVIEQLRAMSFTTDDWDKTDTYPTFGTVTIRQLLATWVVHDLNHLAQIARIMAQYREEVGPWTQFLGILKKLFHF